MKEHLRHERLLATLRFNQALSTGTAVHKGLETRSIEAALKTFEGYYPNDQEDANKLEIAMSSTEAMLEGYFERYPPFEHMDAEIQFELPVIMPGGRKSRKHKIAGKIDGIAVVDGQQWIVEYKTASMIGKGYYEKLIIDSQISMYMYAARRLGYKPVGVIYRVLRKPSLKRSEKKGESVIQFTKRIAETIKAEPEKYFEERQIYRSSADLAAFEKELWEQIKLYDAQHKRRENFRHTGNCKGFGMCEYLPLCTNESGWEALYVARMPNEELETEEEN